MAKSARRRPRLKPFINAFFESAQNQGRWIGPQEVMAWANKQDPDVSKIPEAWMQAMDREAWLDRDGEGKYAYAPDQEESEEEEVYPPPGLSIPWDKVKSHKPRQELNVDDAREQAIMAECGFIEAFDNLLRECRQRALAEGLDMRAYDIEAKREILRALKAPMFLTDSEGKKVDYHKRRLQIREWHKRHRIMIASVPRDT